MSRSYLQTTAADLERAALAEPNQPVRREVSGKLHLTLVYKLTEWRLSFSHPDGPPSHREIEGWLAAFGVPENSRREKAYQTVGQTDWHIVRLIWPSVYQLKIINEDGGVKAIIQHNYQE